MTKQDSRNVHIGSPGMMNPYLDRDAAKIIASQTGGRRALFLDRDGVINKNRGYVHRAEDTEFMSGIFETCRVAAERNYLIVVITNQAGIARGYYTIETFLAYTEWLHEQFRDRGVSLLATYYCPHHPDYPVPGYSENCLCRKPAPGMIMSAARDFSIDLSTSLLVGDMESDVIAGKSAGISRSIRIASPSVGSGVFDEQRIGMVSEIIPLLSTA